MQIDRIPEWHLSAEVDAEIAALLARCFTTDFGGRSFFTHRHHVRLVVRQSGRIVGHMALTLRAVELGDTLVTIAGLAEVATDPGNRGQGIAAALMQAAIAEAKSSPAAFLLLFGEAKVYAAAGCRTVANRIAHVEIKGIRAARLVSDGDDSLMVLPLTDVSWPDDALLDLRGPMF